MKKLIILLIFVILCTSLVSAEIIIDPLPNEIYNLGDTISIPITITSPTKVSGTLQMNLICDGHQINFYGDGVAIILEDEKREPHLVLIKELIGEIKGTCNIKATFRGEDAWTEEFIISDLINVRITSNKTEFNPDDNILINGEAIKENGDDVKGIVELEIISDDQSKIIQQLDTIRNGFFSINISLPDDMKAGQHLVKLTAYEEEMNLAGEVIKTNNGLANYNILVRQIATNLEIVFENSEVEPGTNLEVKAILHDQTGEKIESNAIITIKNEKGKILEQTEISIDEFLEFPIAYNEFPAEWTVVAVSDKMMSEANFRIKEKQEVKVELMNRTILITNIGNVPYNKTILVKIENDSVNINMSLKVDGVQKYILTAPDGEYHVQIITDDGSKITGMAMLSGKTLDIKEASKGVRSFMRYFIWFFIIAVLGFVSFTVFKKTSKKTFFGFRKTAEPKHKKRAESWLGKSKIIPLRKKATSLVHTKNRAELSLSIKGDKQNVSIVCFKIKNLQEIESKKESINETLQKIVSIAEEKKAVIYENQDNLIFILAPVKTRTFKNEKIAVEIAQKIKDVLINHNKLLKQKIDFGISLNYGTIVAKQDRASLKFMSMGTLITTAKKISSISENKIFLSEKINERLRSDVRTQKHEEKGIPVYTIKEVKKHREADKRFINDFIKRMEKK